MNDAPSVDPVDAPARASRALPLSRLLLLLLLLLPLLLVGVPWLLLPRRGVGARPRTTARSKGLRVGENMRERGESERRVRSHGVWAKAAGSQG